MNFKASKNVLSFSEDDDNSDVNLTCDESNENEASDVEELLETETALREVKITQTFHPSNY